jgi:hypothetical protein
VDAVVHQVVEEERVGTAHEQRLWRSIVPGPAKSPRLAKNTGAGESRAVCSTSEPKIASAVGSGQAPLSPATTKENG